MSSWLKAFKQSGSFYDGFFFMQGGHKIELYLDESFCAKRTNYRRKTYAKRPQNDPD